MANIKEFTDPILFEKDNYKALYENIHALSDIYASYTGIRAGNITDKDILLPNGKAISPIKAAHCLLEIQRTAVFLRGIYKAIFQLKIDFPGQKINILYAGCGPYATLLTPFTAYFGREELAFYMLDINPVSLDSVKELFTALGLNAYIAEFICSDATTYQMPKDKVMHMVISETMQNALAKEPQVSIMLNLIPQMHANTIFIPEEINLSLKLVDPAEENKSFSIQDYIPERKEMGELYIIGRANCKEHAPLTLQLPEQINNFRYLNIFTDITVFRDEKLGAYNCGLNLPVRIADLESKASEKITFRYEMNNIPGFRHEWN
jgi:predicted RNA methylase